MKYFKPFLLAIIMLLSVATNVNAQEHLKFMGIPLTGTIDNFQKQLAKKGITMDREANASTPFGTRVFFGRFSGCMCQIVVWYTNKKIVYGARANFETDDLSVQENFYGQTKKNLDQKYNDFPSTVEYRNGNIYDCWKVKSEEGENIIGEVHLQKVTDASGRGFYKVFVDYYDYANYNQKNKENYDDL